MHYLFHTDNNWQVAWACYSGPIDNHYPKRLLLKLPHAHYLELHTQKTHRQCLLMFYRSFFKGLGAYVLYTNATSATKKDCTHAQLSMQQSELHVINQRLSDVFRPLNIVTDSASCAQTTSLLEAARLKPPLLMLSHSESPPLRRLSDNEPDLSV